MSTFPRQLLPKGNFDHHEAADVFTPPESARQSKKTSTACSACKHAKRKCSGRPAPCNACRRAGSECTFDEAADMRRKVAMKRTVSELEGYRELYFSIIKIIRAQDQRFFDQFVTAVRANSPLNDITDVVSTSIHEMRHAEMQSSSPISPLMTRTGAGLSTGQRPSNTRSQHSRMNLKNLCDLPGRNKLKEPLSDT